jgi:hypothetical protein
LDIGAWLAIRRKELIEALGGFLAVSEISPARLRHTSVLRQKRIDSRIPVALSAPEKALATLRLFPITLTNMLVAALIQHPGVVILRVSASYMSGTQFVA